MDHFGWYSENQTTWMHSVWRIWIVFWFASVGWRLALLGWMRGRGVNVCTTAGHRLGCSLLILDGSLPCTLHIRLQHRATLNLLHSNLHCDPTAASTLLHMHGPVDLSSTHELLKYTPSRFLWNAAPFEMWRLGIREKLDKAMLVLLSSRPFGFMTGHKKGS